MLHDSTSPKLPMKRIREEVLRRRLGVVGNVRNPRDIWDKYVPSLFESPASNPFSGVAPPSGEAVIMLRALWAKNLLFPLPPGPPGPNGGGVCYPGDSVEVRPDRQFDISK